VTESTEPPRPAGQDARRIGLWGATQSGKSTFLSALYIAVNRALENDLLIYGADTNSTEFLVRNTTLLNHQRSFPEATQIDQRLAWIVRMRIPNPSRRRFMKHSATIPFDFRIDLQDAPGGYYAAVPGLIDESSPGPKPDPLEADGQGAEGRLDLPGTDEESAEGRLDLSEDGQPADPTGAVASYLAGCQGVLLLIDPLRERDLGDAHEYFHGTLLRMAERAMPAVPADQRLGHYVAVCITKFDDPHVYNFAEDNGYIFNTTRDPRMFPRVSDSDAGRFLHEMCRGYRQSDIELVTSALGKYFYPDRIRYFITSAVGFYTDEDGYFQDGDYQNVVPQQAGEDGKITYSIRGAIHPINVVEPLRWLGESVAAGR
jgi:hypothetical protein